MSQLIASCPLYVVYAVTNDERFVIADALTQESAIEKSRAIRAWSPVNLEIIAPTGDVVGRIG